MKYGVVRNGRHLQLCNTKEETDASIVERKAKIAKLVTGGWITAAQAEKIRYHVAQVKRLPW